MEFLEFLEEYSIEGFSNPSINYSSKNAMDPPALTDADFDWIQYLYDVDSKTVMEIRRCLQNFHTVSQTTKEGMSSLNGILWGDIARYSPILKINH